MIIPHGFARIIRPGIFEYQEYRFVQIAAINSDPIIPPNPKEIELLTIPFRSNEENEDYIFAHAFKK